MNSQRLSLSSSVFAGRIKKFDTYQHDAQTSQRASSRAMPAKAAVLRPVIKPVQQFKQQNVKPAQKINNHEYSSRALNIKLPNASQSLKPLITTAKETVFTTKKELSKPELRETVQNIALSVIANVPIQHSVVIERQFERPIKKIRFSKLRKLTANMPKAQMAFYGFGVLIFMFAGIVSVQTLLTNREAKQQISVLGEQTNVPDESGVAESIDGSAPAEAEVTPKAYASYKVDPEAPRYLIIPDIGVKARIKSTGLTKAGAVDAPKNLNDVSWYNESAVPGNANGASLLLGHMSGWTVPGVFKKINKLQAGMRFEVEKGNGEKLTYEVVKGEQIPVSQLNMSKILREDIAGQHDLKLMTCSGKYNKNTKEFEDRYIVYAKIIR
ncbi:MAG: class F sortase [Candidatus Zixiibacteriota bacterium]